MGKELFFIFIHIFEGFTDNRNVIFLKGCISMMFVKAFIVGGLICVIGQILIDKTKLTVGRILVGYVVAGVILGALGLFEYLEKFAGAGATVPLLGFGAALAKGTKELIAQDGWVGILTGPLTAGAGGIMAAVLAGLIMSFFTKPKAK